ncbi:hypothetical protein VE03_00018 [Pseudogymnoascus sp. 23342-1-I1]|nr:hypothetical protein VE03_00018 [Pseudogymnoascus sp. 23342-1-I1]
MKFSTAVLISASAALTSATAPDYNPDTNTWTCHVPDAVYCAGDSLKTNIIIRCTGLVGYAGNCNDNLAGQPPVGVQPSVCYAPELHSAACAKNCIVYGGSGNLDGTFPLPADVCTPTVTSTSTAEPTVTSTTTSEPEPTATTTEPEPTATTVTDGPEPTTTTEPEPTATTTEPEPTTTTTTKVEPTTTTSCEPTSTAEPTQPPHTDSPTQPPHTDSPTLPPVTVTITISECPTTPLPPATLTTVTHTNGTSIAHPTGGNGNGNGNGGTNTPVGPSSTISPPIPGAGVRSAGASLGMVVLAAVVGFAV